MGNITRKIRIPTGYLFTGEYSHGELETLSIGDYGKRHNIKADFLGFHDDEENGLVTCGNLVLSGSEVRNEVL